MSPRLRWVPFATIILILVATDIGLAKDRFILATGRRDPRIRERGHQ